MTLPSFTAEAGLGSHSRHYRARNTRAWASHVSAVIPQQGMSYGVGTRCIGHHLYYIYVEAEDPDHIAVHTVDLKASC
jgi:hypothetical protein